MAEETSLMSYWIKFFVNSGIPAGEATNYAVTFTDNRIQKDMLLELSKEYLKDMGITVLGDIICILRHAKLVHTQEAREKVLKSSSPSAQLSNTPTPRRSTAASRIVDYYLGKDPNAVPMNTPQPSKICEDLSSTDKLKNLRKSSVFERLGDTGANNAGSTKVTLTGSGNVIVRSTGSSKVSSSTSSSNSASSSSQSLSSSSVFSRLGEKPTLKRPASSTSGEDDNTDGPPLEYAGILKSLPGKTKPKKAKLSATQSNDGPKMTKKKLSSTPNANPATPTSHKITTSPSANESSVSTAGILSPDAKPLEAISAKRRLGKIITAPATSTTSRKNNLEKKEPSPGLLQKKGVKSRLGVQRCSEVTSTADEPQANDAEFSTSGSSSSIDNSGVFSRLGRPVLS